MTFTTVATFGHFCTDCFFTFFTSTISARMVKRTTLRYMTKFVTVATASDPTLTLRAENGRQPLCSSPTKKNPQKLNSSNVKLASLNIQSVMSAKKKPNFWNFLDSVDADIVCGCETWLSPSVGDSEVLPSNSPYNIYRKDRSDGYGGSLLLIKSDIINEPVDIQTSCDLIFGRFIVQTHRP